jgi:branched-chain amino acid transport system substrate-binding protein
MKRANSVEPAKYLPSCRRPQLPGVTGKITFDERGDIKDGAITLYQAKGGKWETLETVGGAAPAPAPAAMSGMGGMTAAPAQPAAMGGMSGMAAAPTPAAAPAAAPAEKK